MDIVKIYNDLKNNKKPPNEIITNNNGHVKYVISNSNRNDVVCLKYIKNNTYAGIRIKSKQESQNEMIQRNMKKPICNSNKKFKHCTYQLGKFNIPEFREENININHSIVHTFCHWNNKNVTRLRTAHSAKQLETAWLEYIKT